MGKTNLSSEKITKGFRIPHVWTIILFCLVLGGIMTYLVPAGVYDRIESGGRMLINPDSFHYVDQTPVAPFDWFVAIVDGLTGSMAIMSMIWFTIASTDVYTESGTLHKIVGWIMKVCRGNYILIMGALMAFFAVRGAMGAFELHIPFVPITIALALACGCDVMTGLVIALVPTFVAFGYGPINVYTVAVAQGIAGLPVYSAMGFRVAVWLVMMAVTFWFILRYATRVRKDNSISPTGFQNPSSAHIDIEAMQQEKMTGRQKILTFMLIATIGLQMAGPMLWKWGFAEIGALWLISGIIAGLVAGFSNERICEIMGNSCAGIFSGVICIGLARSVSVVLAEGNILDTIVYGLSIPLQQIPASVLAVGMIFIQALLNFFIPSGSGQATVAMPIMAPLSDVIGLTRQTAVMAFQLGDGLTNLIMPTTGALFVYLGVAKVPYSTYFKWIFPLFLMLIGIAIVSILIATFIHLGPF